MRGPALWGMVVLVGGGLPAAAGEPAPLERVEGRLLQIGPGGITGTEIGSFQLESAGAGDLRETPGTATLTLDAGGALVEASGLASEAREVDTASGRPLRRGGTSCPTGLEAGCLPVSHCPPTLTGPDPLVECDVSADANAFRAINGATLGFSSLDRRAGALTIFNSNVNVITGSPVPADQLLQQSTLASFFANLLVGDAGAHALASAGLTGGVSIPHVALNLDACDGLASDCASPGMPPNGFPVFMGPQLNEALTAEQQATLGCGELHGTNCEALGIALFQLEAGALLQSLLSFHMPVTSPGDPGPDGIFDTADDITPLATNPFQVQPGTVDFPADPACLRSGAGQGDAVLPGCQGPGLGDYSPLVDGCTGPDDPGVAGDEACSLSNGGAGAADLLHPFFDPASAFYQGPFDLDGNGAPESPLPAFDPRFATELNVLSFNAVMAFAALSAPPDVVLDPSCTPTPTDDCLHATDENGDGLPDPKFVAQTEFDASSPAALCCNGFDDDGDGVVDNPEEGDPDRIGPFRKDGCSFAAPYACANLVALADLVTQELDDDPSGPPQRRWVWETGAEYLQTDEASGGLADFADWTFHALGPEVSRGGGSALPPIVSPRSGRGRAQPAGVSQEAGVLFVLGPPETLQEPPDSPLVLRSAGPDGMAGTADDPFVGLAYGVVPEPSTALLGVVALVAAAGLASRRRI